MFSYGPLCTDFYDADKPIAPADALEYYLRRAKRSGGPVLEPMCGSGRFLIPLLRAGIEIEGVDAAPAMLKACRLRASLDGLNPLLHLQALEGLALPRKYRMAFIPSGSISLLHTPTLQVALGQIRRHLEPGAILLLELVCPRTAQEVGGSLESRVVQIDDETSIAYSCQTTPAPDGASISYVGRYEKLICSTIVETEHESLILSLLQPERFVELLVTSGFHEASILSSSEYAGLSSSGCLLIEAKTAG